MAQEWGSQPSDFNLEPRRVFINLILWNMRDIMVQLFMGGKFSRSISSMRALISVLDEKSKKALKPQLDKLSQYENNINVIKTKVEAEHVFQEITDYLHRSYLREVNYAKPIRPSKDRMRVPV